MYYVNCKIGSKLNVYKNEKPAIIQRGGKLPAMQLSPSFFLTDLSIVLFSYSPSPVFRKAEITDISLETATVSK